MLLVKIGEKEERVLYGQRRGYYEPEDLGAEQDRRDAAVLGRGAFWLVLAALLLWWLLGVLTP